MDMCGKVRLRFNLRSKHSSNNTLARKFLSVYIIIFMFLAIFSIISAATVNAKQSGSSEEDIDNSDDNGYELEDNDDKSKGNNGKSKSKSGESEGIESEENDDQSDESEDNDEKPKGNGDNSKSNKGKSNSNNGKPKGNDDKQKGNDDKQKGNDDKSKGNKKNSENNDDKRVFKWLDKDNKKVYDEETLGSGSSSESGTSGYSNFAVIGGEAFGTPGSYNLKRIDISWMTITTFIALLTFILVVFLFKAKIIYLPR